MTVQFGFSAMKRLASLSKTLPLRTPAFASRSWIPSYIRFFRMIQRLSSSDAMDISLSKHRTDIGSSNSDLFFSASTARQINRRIAVRDTCDRFIINLLCPQLTDV
jgi:hypothetical protein